MTDTAQPVEAAENALESAAEAFKAFLNPQPTKPRDETGRFASASEPDEDEPEALDDNADDAPEEGGDLDDTDDADEAADDAQPEAADMPSSWSKEDAELWQSLPAEAQARIAEREAQRDAGLNQKLQEAANARKLVEQQAAAANANRDHFAQAIDQVVELIQYPKPDPVQYGLGSEYFDRDNYDLAVWQWEQSSAQVSTLMQQRQAIAAQQAQEAERARLIAHQEIEQVAWPKFVADVPELQDTAKGRQVLAEVVEYAKKSGIPSNIFDDPDMAKSLTSAELHLTWKAMQYDRIKAAEQRVKAKNPPPKPSSPAVKPGGITPKNTVQANRLGKAQARLAKEGSIQAGADVFKQLFSTR